MANDHKRSAYTQDQDFGGDDLRARIHECQAATHARADELAGRPPSEKQKKHAAKGRLFRRSAWQHRRVENLRKRPKAPVEPLLDAARTSARAGEAGSPGAKRAAGIRSGTDPGDDSDQPSPARACLRCGRDLSHRRSDAKTCGTTCRKQVERHGPLAVAEPLRAVLCRCNGHHIVDEFGDGCAKCGHFLPTLEEAA